MNFLQEYPCLSHLRSEGRNVLGRQNVLKRSKMGSKLTKSPPQVGNF